MQSRLVRDELSPVFGTLWTRPAGMTLYRVPNACGELVWCDGEFFVYGPRVTLAKVAFPATSSPVGLRFLPGAAAKWLGAAAPEIVDATVPLVDFGKQRARRLVQAIGDAHDPHTVAERLENALIRTIDSQATLNRACLTTVLDLLEHEHGRGGFLRGLQAAFDCGERSARRETIKLFGYAPKTAERIWRVQRFLRSVASHGAPNLASLANASGFSDQAHMTRELRSIAGVTPGQVLRLAQHLHAVGRQCSERVDRSSPCRVLHESVKK